MFKGCIGDSYLYLEVDLTRGCPSGESTKGSLRIGSGKE